MKKRIISVVLMLAMLSSAVACKSKESSEDSTEKTEKTTQTSDSETESETTETTESTTSETTSEPDTGVFTFTKDNYPVIDGSTSTKPMATAITSVMLGIPRSEADSSLEFHKTSASFNYLMEGTADMLICAQPADSVFEDMKNAGFEYEMEPFSAEALVFVVNASNPVESLTTEQIQKIYTGEITNWKEVGGEDKEIVAIQRNETAGSQVMMEKLVMGDLPMMEAPQELMPGDMAGLISVVKSYDNSAGAIGYTPYYYATNMKMADGLKIIKVDDVIPDSDTIGKGEYPFCTAYYVVLPKKAAADAPARILYDWILSEEGQKLAEMEGYVPASKDPSSHNARQVEVEWGAYQPATMADAVYTRLQDDEISDFIPSSDYERVFPYAGSLKKGYESWSSKKGFFSISGQIVCDAVYDYVYSFDAEHYIVTKYEYTDPSDPYAPVNIRVGVISADGKAYTGLKYSSALTRRWREGKLYLVETKDQGINVYPYDLQKNTVGDPVFYKLDRSGENPYADVSLLDTISDRYAIYQDEFEEYFYVYDGQTGQPVSFPDDIRLTYTAGNLVYGFDESRDNSEILFFRPSGEQVNLPKRYTGVEQMDGDTYLLLRLDLTGWEVMDADGNILASLDDDGNVIGIWNYSISKEYFYTFSDSHVNMYDHSFKLIKSVELDSAKEYSNCECVGNYFSSRFTTFAEEEIIYRAGYVETDILNLQTGEKTSVDGSYDIEQVPGYLILYERNVYDFSRARWMILDISDFHKIAEGIGYTEVFEDMKTHSFWLVERDDYRTSHMSLIDVTTGERVFPEVPNPREEVLEAEYFYDGKVIYTTWQQYDSVYDSGCSSTNMADRDGNVIFLYNTVYLSGD